MRRTRTDTRPKLAILIDVAGDDRPRLDLAQFLATAAEVFAIEIHCPQSDDLAGRAQLRAFLGRQLLACFRAANPTGAERRASEVLRRIALPYGTGEHAVFHLAPLAAEPVEAAA